MKFFIKTMFVALVSLMFNCHKSSENPNAIIAGTWTEKSSVTTGCTDPSSNLTDLYTCPATTSTSCFSITFNSNGTFSSVSSWINYSTGAIVTQPTSGTFSIKGDQLTGSSSGNTSTITFTLSSDKKTLTLISKNASTGCTDTDTYIKN